MTFLKLCPLLLIAVTTISCGVSYEKLTDPAKRDRDRAEAQKQQNLQNFIRDQEMKQALPLRNQEEACAGAQATADKYKVELKDCSLANDTLALSVKGSEETIFERSFDISQSESEMLNTLADENNGRVTAYWVSIIRGVSLAKKYQLQ